MYKNTARIHITENMSVVVVSMNAVSYSMHDDDSVRAMVGKKEHFSVYFETK